MTLPAGKRLGPHEVVALIGGGRDGAVYRAHLDQLGIADPTVRRPS